VLASAQDQDALQLATTNGERRALPKVGVGSWLNGLVRLLHTPAWSACCLACRWRPVGNRMAACERWPRFEPVV